ncbi:hypothetical protein ZEAMMB73_Zm00001d047415 [Zea mays]|uniref:Uncharacterized protein n=1 Tax=Zea mays TaxID=4577 RepID=A0A1D6P997_MAIZE|nr:hypothetical protein ZEAMMB73_Zm00001d047415 [Zea mays]
MVTLRRVAADRVAAAEVAQFVVLVPAWEEVTAKGVFSARREGGGTWSAVGHWPRRRCVWRRWWCSRRAAADAGQGPRGRPGRMRCGATRLEGIPEEDATTGLCGWCRCECDDDRWEVVGGGGGAGGRDGDGALGNGGGRVGRVPRRWPPRFPSVWGRWGIACGRRGHGRAAPTLHS